MAMREQKILLSGGTGYVGSKFINRLAHRTDVVVHRLGRSPGDEVQWHDLIHLDLPGLDTVYHLAGSTDLFSIKDDAVIHRQANVTLTEAIFAYFLRSDATTFVYMSTAKVMGEGRSEGYRVSEMPLPLSVYAKSKYEAECRLQQMWLDYRATHPSTHKRWVVLRPTMIYGADTKRGLWLLWRWVNWGMPVLRSWRGVYRSMVSIESVLDVLEAIPMSRSLFPCYFLADLPTLSLGEILNRMSLSCKKPLKFWTLSDGARKWILVVDRLLFRGKIAWQLKKLEEDFVVEGEGVWGVKGSDNVRLSVKRLDDTVLGYRLQEN